MLEAPVFVRRVTARVSRDQRRAHARFEEMRTGLRRSIAHAVAPPAHAGSPANGRRTSQAGPIGRRRAAAHPARPSRSLRPLLARIPRLTDLAADRRGAPILVLGLLLLATVVAALPGTTQGTGNTGRPEAAPVARIYALSGTAQDLDLDERAFQGPGEAADAAEPVLDAQVAPADRPDAPDGPFTVDGTLVKPLAVDTSVPNVADQVRTYTVRAGDTLTGIGNRFGVSMMTIWWANRLSAKDQLKIGQELIIPPTDGILYTVREGDSLASIAAAYKAEPAQIIRFNELHGDVVVIGQQLMVPDGRGAPIATPKPKAPAPTTTTTTTRPTSSRPSTGCAGCSFGGSMRWPVAGGSISQYFHYGHYAIDIQAPYGTSVYAADDGKVVFSGWRSNGGGYQVWISHGGNVYTTYNHLSSLSAGTGSYVGRGQRIGRVGSSGYATGPHLHFEVWIGPIWNGGYRVNPLKYL